jgi:hypothetical protein
MMTASGMSTTWMATSRMATSRMAAAVLNAADMANRRGAGDRSMVKVFLMAAVVMMFFPRMMVVEIGVIDRTAPNRGAPCIWGVSARRVVGISVVVPTTAVKASAAEACTEGQDDKRLK